MTAAFDSTPMGYYLLAVLTLAGVALVLALGVATQTLVSNRRARLTRRQSVRSYYGCVALRH